jgi:excisionase family DNA binding protein
MRDGRERNDLCGARARGDRRSALAALEGRATISVEAAAILLGIGRSTAYAAARDGSLPTIRLSHRLLVPTAKLAAMLGLEDEAFGD